MKDKLNKLNINETYVYFYENESIDEKLILYEVNYGNIMSDYPYEIFINLLENPIYDKYKHIWVLNDLNLCKKEYLNKDNIKFIDINSNDYLMYLSKAKYLINNNEFQSFFIRKNDQYYLKILNKESVEFINNNDDNNYKLKNIKRNLIQSTHIMTSNEFIYDAAKELDYLRGIYNGYIFNYNRNLDNSNNSNIENVIDFFFNNNLKNSFQIKDDKKNILMYCGGFLNNGITSSAINLLNNLNYNKYNVFVVIKNSKNSEFKFNITKINKNCKLVYYIGNKLYFKNEKDAEEFIFNNGINCNLNSIPDILNLYKREYRRLFGDSSFDTVIDFSGYNKFWTLLFSISPIDNKIIYQHNDILSEYNKLIDGKFKHKKNLDVIFPLYSYFNKIVSVSSYTMDLNKDGLCKMFNGIEDKFFVVNNSIDFKSILSLYNDSKLVYINDIFYEDKRECVEDKILFNDSLKKHEGKIKFFNIARLSPEKDHFKLLNSFSKLVKEFNNVVLYIIGDGILKREIIDKIIDLGLEKNVVLTGYLKNPFIIAKYCDCFVLSSNYEGQPMVLLEMLILNKDIIATDIPGNRSVLEDGYGVLCKNNEDELFKAMKNYVLYGINNKKTFNYHKYNKKSLEMFYNIL